MRQLLPEPGEVDPAVVHAAAFRPALAHRPWVLANMVASVDGATALDGVSGGLSGPGDKEVFSALRAVSDVIFVAAGTARTEGYGPPRTPADRRAEREARGQAPYPRLALVSRSLDLDPLAELFSAAPEPPIILTSATADRDRHRALSAVAEVVTVETDPPGGEEAGVDLGRALGELGTRGVSVVLTEGGPALIGQLVAAGLLDELNLTLAPKLVGGTSARLASGPTEAPTELDLAHLWEAEGMLLCRYVRR
ncbi:pyrimidine reductase family protein [soil metagenome]